jgi:hypothetical protein
MRKMIDAVSGGELWMEITAGLTVWHVDELDERGRVVRGTALSDAGKAKAAWRKLKTKLSGGAAEKGAGA